MPGPGNYSTLDDSFTKKSAPKYGIGTEKRENSYEKDTPGPSTYNALTFTGKEGKKMSISPKLNDNFQEKESRNKPGPASYNHHTAVSSALKHMPSYKIGTSKRYDSLSKERISQPDPSTYTPSKDFVKTSSAAFGFGTSKR